MLDKYLRVMREWVLNLQPQAFGPLLLTLSSSPQAFTVKEEQGERYFNKDQTHLLQQQAIERCLGWISSKKGVENQFEETIICMNPDGTRPTEAGLAYCKNKMRLDIFMAEQVMPLIKANNHMRAKYHQYVSSFGSRLNKHCKYHRRYTGPAFAPTETIEAFYKGPDID